MDYKDYFERFDKETFEVLAKEYAKKTYKNTQILSQNQQKNDENKADFLQKYEALLGVVFYIKRLKNPTKNYLKHHKNIALNQEFDEIIKGLCQMYFELFGEYYFSPFDCKIIDNFESKNELFFAIKNILLSPFYLLENNKKSLLLDNLFRLVRLIVLGYFD